LINEIFSCLSLLILCVGQNVLPPLPPDLFHQTPEDLISYIENALKAIQAAKSAAVQPQVVVH